MDDFDSDHREYSGMTRGGDVAFVISVLALFILVVISDLWARYRTPILANFIMLHGLCRHWLPDLVAESTPRFPFEIC